MQKLFFDTNLFIDYFQKGGTYGDWVQDILQEQADKKVKIYTSNFAVLTIQYIIKKIQDDKKAREAVAFILKRVTVLSVDNASMFSALGRNFSDYEVAVMHECAFDQGKIDYIITRDIKDFKNSLVEVMTPEEFCLTRM